MINIQKYIEEKIAQNSGSVQEWLNDKYQQISPNLYNSIDFRHSGFKIAPVDVNSFPAGFNNFSQSSIAKGQKLFQQYLENYFPNAKKILIIPENHTRNLQYLDNIYFLKKIISINDLEVNVGSFAIEDNETKITIKDYSFMIEKLKIINNKIITISGFDPDLIIINNDFTTRPDNFWQTIKQNIIPALNFGWFNRSKFNHFKQYQKLIIEFAEIINIDPWLISIFFDKVNDVDFKSSQNLHDLQEKIAQILSKITQKYQQYQIKQHPYCYVKADNGTYGMGIIQIHHCQEILQLNKKNRNKMNIIKEKTKNTSVIIQEGVRTIEKYNDFPAEYMSYCINGKLVTNIMRFNQNRNNENSLNARGMEFIDIADQGFSLNNVISIISQISCLACSLEFTL